MSLSRNRLFFVVALLLVEVLAAGRAAASDVCDPGLRGNDASPMAYQMRGDRCEGIYKLEVNSTLLKIASIVERFEAFDSNLPENLKVEWSLPRGLAAEGARLRAMGLAQRSYYRMDTALPAKGTTFEWPLEILDRAELTKEDLGVYAWVPHPQPPDKDFTEIYLPLRIYQESRPPRRKMLEIAFLPEVKLKEAYVSVALVDAKAKRLAAPMMDKKPLEYGYYPAKTPVFFEISDLAATGYYQVDLLALDTIGGSMSYRFLLYFEEPRP